MRVLWTATGWSCYVDCHDSTGRLHALAQQVRSYQQWLCNLGGAPPRSDDAALEQALQRLIAANDATRGTSRKQFLDVRKLEQLEFVADIFDADAKKNLTKVWELSGRNGRIWKPSTPGAPLKWEDVASSQRGNKSRPSLGTSSSGGAGKGGASPVGPLAAKRTATYYRVTMKLCGFRPTVRSTTIRAAGLILESISNQSESTWGSRLRDVAEGEISVKEFKHAMPLVKHLRVDKLDAPDEAVPDSASMVSKLPPDVTRRLRETFKAFIPGRGPRGGGSAENDEAGCDSGGSDGDDDSDSGSASDRAPPGSASGSAPDRATASGKGKRERPNGGGGSSLPPQIKRPRLWAPELEQDARALRLRHRGALARGDGQGHTPTSASSSEAKASAASEAKARSSAARTSVARASAARSSAARSSAARSSADCQSAARSSAALGAATDVYDSDGASVATTKMRVVLDVDDDSESSKPGAGAGADTEEEAVISVDDDDDSEDGPGAGGALSREGVREMELRAAQGAVLRVLAELDRERAKTEQLRANVDQLLSRDQAQAQAGAQGAGEGLQASVSQLRREKVQAEAALSEAAGRLAAAQSELASRETELQGALSERRAAAAQLEKARSQLATLQAQCRSEATRAAHVEGELLRERAKYEQQRAKTEELTAKVERLRAAVSNFLAVDDHRAQAVAKMIEAQRAQLGAREADLATANATGRALAEQLGAAREQLSALQVQHKAHEQRAADQLREERRRAFAEHEREQQSLRVKMQELESELRSRGLVLAESDRVQRVNQTLQRRVEVQERSVKRRAPRPHAHAPLSITTSSRSTACATTSTRFSSSRRRPKSRYYQA